MGTRKTMVILKSIMRRRLITKAVYECIRFDRKKSI